MPEYTNDGTLDYTTEMQAEPSAPTESAATDYDFIASLIAQTTVDLTGDQSYLQQYDDQMRSVASVNQEAGVAAPATNIFTEAAKWFDSQKDSTKGAIIATTGSFLKGLFSYGETQKATKILQQRADADTKNAQTAELNAQTAAAKAKADEDKTKQEFANASSIGETNFGSANPRGLIFRPAPLVPVNTRRGTR